MAANRRSRRLCPGVAMVLPSGRVFYTELGVAGPARCLSAALELALASVPDLKTAAPPDGLPACAVSPRAAIVRAGAGQGALNREVRQRTRRRAQRVSCRVTSPGCATPRGPTPPRRNPFAGFRHQDGWVRSVLLHLLAQAIDVGLQRVRSDPGIIPPYFLQQDLARFRTAAGAIESQANVRRV
jgi:hypothetical protein